MGTSLAMFSATKGALTAKMPSAVHYIIMSFGALFKQFDSVHELSYEGRIT